MTRAEHDEGERLDVGVTVPDTRPAIPSASIVVVRDGDDGLEVFMLERHIESDFAGGAYVFPGGKVDGNDRALDPARWTGVDPTDARAELEADTAEEALGLLVAAVRETFEEAGILLATARGERVTADLLRTAPFRAARERLNDRRSRWDWGGWLEEQDVVLDLGTLAFLAWWVTPEGLHRRYDTRFFVTTVPGEQADLLRHDDVETTASHWVAPMAALRAAEAGETTIVFPTRKLLASLAGYQQAKELVTAAREGRTDRRRLQPTLVKVDGATRVQHPDGGPPERG